MTSVSSLQGLLARFDAFRDVEPHLLAEISSVVKPCSCAAGHELLVAHEMPEQVFKCLPRNRFNGCFG